MKRGRPVKDLDRGGDGDQHAHEGEHHAGVHRLAADEHVVPPHEEARDGVPMLARATAVYPKMRLREKQVMISLTTPIAGSTMM
jgi:hypothetical protein